MTRLAHILIIAGFASLWLGCHQPPPRQATEAALQSFVGKTVGELLDTQHLPLSDCRFSDEPPGVLRALFFPKQGLRVALKRQPSLFSQQMRWAPDVVRQAEIVGVR